MNALPAFCRQVRSRSAEYAKAMRVLESDHLPGVMVSLLRQELDSMIRVIYLLATSDMSERRRLIEASVAGERWTRIGKKGKPAVITDDEMQKLSTRLHNWAKNVYKFGCNFIHLSAAHDYNDRDPFVNLPAETQREIIDYLRFYHGGRPTQEHPTFADLTPLFPEVLEKISGNLERHLKQLEAGEVLTI
jgi:hypothetical protein